MSFWRFLLIPAIALLLGSGCWSQPDDGNQAAQHEPASQASDADDADRQEAESGREAPTAPAAQTSPQIASPEQPEDLPPLEIDEAVFGFRDDYLMMSNRCLTPQGTLHPDLMKAAATRRGITRILCSSGITDRGVAQLADLPWAGEVEYLGLSGAAVTDAALDELAKMPALEELALADCTRITDNGLSALQRLDKLTELYLGGTKIDDAGLQYLVGLKQLKTLDIGATKVTGSGLEHLAELKQLNSLNLSFCRLTDAGLAHLAGLSTLESLDLSDHLFPNERVSNITGAGLRHLARLTNLKTLKLDYANVADGDIEQLLPLRRLESLSLVGTKVGDAGAKQLAQLAGLTSLSLNGTPIGDAGMQSLARLENLSKLKIEKTAVTDAGLEHLARLKSLKSLHLQDSRVTFAGVRKLGQALADLKIEGAPQQDLAEHLVDVTPLAELDLASEYTVVNALAYSPDGRLLAAAGRSISTPQFSYVKLWDARTHKPVDEFKLGGKVNWLSFSGDGKLLLVGGEDQMVGKAWIREVEAKNTVHTLTHGTSVRRAEFLPGGETCFTVGVVGNPALMDTSIIVWNDKSAKETATFAEMGNLSTLSTDGKLLAKLTLLDGLELLDAESKAKVKTLNYPAEPDILETKRYFQVVAPLMFSRDDRLLAFGISESNDDDEYAPVKIWNVGTGQRLSTLKQYGTLQSVALSPDSRLAAAGGFILVNFLPRGRVKLFDVAGGQERCTFVVPRVAVNALTFSPDGKVLAVGCEKIRLWNVEKLLNAAQR